PLKSRAPDAGEQEKEGLADCGLHGGVSSAADDVVDLDDLRLPDVDAELAEDRHQGPAKRLEVLRRVEHVRDAEGPLVAVAAVVQPSRRGARTSSLEPAK